VTIGGREYVDGGVWSMTNLDVALVGRGTEVLCLNVIAGVPAPLGTPLGLMRAGARAAETVETQALRSRGASVRVIGPDAASVAAIGGRLMDDRRAPGALAAGYRQGVALGREG
jgi:NTE family protein